MPEEIVLLVNPPTPGARLTTIWVWVGIRANGDEAVISADLPIDDEGERRHMPLMASRREVAERLKGLANTVVRLSKKTADPLERAELRLFEARQDAP